MFSLWATYQAAGLRIATCKRTTTAEAQAAAAHPICRAGAGSGGDGGRTMHVHGGWQTEPGWGIMHEAECDEGSHSWGMRQQLGNCKHPGHHSHCIARNQPAKFLTLEQTSFSPRTLEHSDFSSHLERRTQIARGGRHVRKPQALCTFRGRGARSLSVSCRLTLSPVSSDSSRPIRRRWTCSSAIGLLPFNRPLTGSEREKPA